MFCDYLTSFESLKIDDFINQFEYINQIAFNWSNFERKSFYRAFFEQIYHINCDSILSFINGLNDFSLKNKFNILANENFSKNNFSAIIEIISYLFCDLPYFLLSYSDDILDFIYISLKQSSAYTKFSKNKVSINEYEPIMLFLEKFLLKNLNDFNFCFNNQMNQSEINSFSWNSISKGLSCLYYYKNTLGNENECFSLSNVKNIIACKQNLGDLSLDEFLYNLILNGRKDIFEELLNIIIFNPKEFLECFTHCYKLYEITCIPDKTLALFIKNKTLFTVNYKLKCEFFLDRVKSLAFDIQKINKNLINKIVTNSLWLIELIKKCIDIYNIEKTNKCIKFITYFERRYTENSLVKDNNKKYTLDIDSLYNKEEIHSFTESLTTDRMEKEIFNKLLTLNNFPINTGFNYSFNYILYPFNKCSFEINDEDGTSTDEIELKDYLLKQNINLTNLDYSYIRTIWNEYDDIFNLQNNSDFRKIFNNTIHLDLTELCTNIISLNDYSEKIEIENKNRAFQKILPYLYNDILKNNSNLFRLIDKNQIIINMFATSEFLLKSQQNPNKIIESDLTFIAVNSIKATELFFESTINFIVNNNSKHIKNLYIKNIKGDFVNIKNSSWSEKCTIGNMHIYLSKNIFEGNIKKQDLDEFNKLTQNWINTIRNDYLHKKRINNITITNDCINTSMEVINKVLMLVKKLIKS